MKIPTTPPGNPPYYPGQPMNGVEVNPQWQGNGVILDGSIAANGAPYIVPQVHPAGYAPPQGYYGPNSPPQEQGGNDFAEYMWMENMEEFDEQIMQQLEEEALMEQCLEHMLADEREAQSRAMNEGGVFESNLNPLAAEFVPKSVLLASSTTTNAATAVAASTTTTTSEPTPAAVEAEDKTDVPVEKLEAAMAELDVDSTDGSALSTSCSGDAENNKSQKSDDEVVVVSAKEVVKTAREQKVDSNKKQEKPKTEQKTNKDTKRKEESPKPSKETTNNKPSPSSSPETVETKPVEKPEAPPVDLQGPPLPTPAALATAPAAAPEPEVKAPVVFNYAAAAKANLPPKQPSASIVSVPPKADSSAPALAKTEDPQPSEAPKPKGGRQPAKAAPGGKKGKK